MKLYLHGTDNKYAAEQTLLTLFPTERPEYPEGAPEGERCELSVTRGATSMNRYSKQVLNKEKVA